MLSSKYINNNIYINYFRSISRIVEQQFETDPDELVQLNPNILNTNVKN